MDQNYRTIGNVIVVIILTFSGLLCLGLGVGFLMSYPDKIWWLGVALAGSGVLLLFGSFQSFQSWRREHKASSLLISHLSRPSVPSINTVVEKQASAPKAQEVLASWVYSAGEWQQFIKWEQKERRQNVLMECFWIVVLGTMLLTLLKGATLITALSICSGLALFYGIVKYAMTMQSIEGHRNSLPEVIITPEAALVNGKLNRFYGENLWLGKVDIKETSVANILEITYWWNTRKGKTYDELRLPVPKGKLREAVAVQQALMNLI